MTARSEEQQARIDEIQAIERLMQFGYWQRDVTLILRHDRLCGLVHLADTPPADDEQEGLTA